MKLDIISCHGINQAFRENIIKWWLIIILIRCYSIIIIIISIIVASIIAIIITIIISISIIIVGNIVWIDHIKIRLTIVVLCEF